MNDNPQNRQETILSHLEELRSATIKSFICIVILFPFCYYFSLSAIGWLKQLSCLRAYNLIYIQPLELFFTRLKVGFFLALFVSFPYVAFHLWKFISPALFQKEQYYLKRFALLSSALFAAGACLGLFVVFPAVLNFAVKMSSPGITPMISVANFVGLALILMLGFGMVFQLPIFVYILASTGLIEIRTIKRLRPIIIICVFVAAAVLTPPDVLSQLAMAIPSLILFEISLWFASIAQKRKLNLTTKNTKFTEN